MTSKVLLAVLVASLFAPLATAQLGGTSATATLTVTAPTAPIPYGGSVEVPVQVVVNCAAILEAAGSGMGTAEVAIHADEAPSWLTVEEAHEDVTVDACPRSLPTGTVTVDSKVKFTVSKDAPGVVPQNVTLVAHIGEDVAEDEAEVLFTVEYFSNYTVVADALFPLSVKNGLASFNVTVTQRSNARSMVMFEHVTETAGKLSGLVSTVYESSAPKRYPVTFKAPVGEWTNATVKFTTFGHWLLLDQTAGNFTDAKTFTYSFLNGGGSVAGSETSNKPAPGAGIGLISVLLVAALVAARRRSA